MKLIKFAISSILSASFAVSPFIFNKSEASSFHIKETSDIGNSVEISVKQNFVPFRPLSFAHGCGTECRIDVGFTSDVSQIGTSDGRTIRMASIRVQQTGGRRVANQQTSSNRYIFAECSASRLAFSDSLTIPSRSSSEWRTLSRSQSDYATVSGYIGGYFDSLCFGRIR